MRELYYKLVVGIEFNPHQIQSKEPNINFEKMVGDNNLVCIDPIIFIEKGNIRKAISDYFDLRFAIPYNSLESVFSTDDNTVVVDGLLRPDVRSANDFVIKKYSVNPYYNESLYLDSMNQAFEKGKAVLNRKLLIEFGQQIEKWICDGKKVCIVTTELSPDFTKYFIDQMHLSNNIRDAVHTLQGGFNTFINKKYYKKTHVSTQQYASSKIALMEKALDICKAPLSSKAVLLEGSTGNCLKLLQNMKGKFNVIPFKDLDISEYYFSRIEQLKNLFNFGELAVIDEGFIRLLAKKPLYILNLGGQLSPKHVIDGKFNMVLKNKQEENFEKKEDFFFSEDAVAAMDHSNFHITYFSPDDIDAVDITGANIEYWSIFPCL